ncbi:hypothetical protein HG531_007831 [Fusarium graminearum]|nr:hypothetical protein HG531_007831 [Fusarium graminearum]
MSHIIAILTSNLIQHNCLVLAALIEKEFRRLEKVEDEESDDEHGKGDDADSDNKVPPTLFDRPVADEEPCDQRRDELSKGPPDGQQCKQSAGSIREELEEQSSINREIATDSEAKSSEEETDATPALGIGGHDAENAGDE